MTDLYNNNDSKQVRRKLRRQMPPCEYILWSRLRGKQVNGLKFRRQYGVGQYVLDFYCPEVMLAVEIDGYSHTFEEQWIHDEVRQQYLESLGILIVRFTNDRVHRYVDGVIDQIAAEAEMRKQVKNAG